MREGHALGDTPHHKVGALANRPRAIHQNRLLRGIVRLDECIRSIIEDKKRPDFGGPANSIVEVERLVGAKATPGRAKIASKAEKMLDLMYRILLALAG